MERPFCVCVLLAIAGCSRLINDVFKDEAGKFDDEFFQSCIFVEQCVNVRMAIVIALIRR